MDKLDSYTISKCIDTIRQKHQYQKDKMYEYGQKLNEDPTNKRIFDMFLLFKNRMEGLEIAMAAISDLSEV